MGAMTSFDGIDNLSCKREGSIYANGRGPYMQEVGQCREQLSRFLSEGSPQGRMGQGPYTATLLLNPPVLVICFTGLRFY